MNLRTVRIGARLGIGFGIILVLVLCVIAADITISTSSRHTTNSGLKRANAKAVLANSMRSAVLEGGIAMRNVGLQHSLPEMLKEEAKAKEQREKFLALRDQLLALHLDDNEKALVEKIVALNEATDAPFKEAIQKVKDYANEAAGTLISTRIDPLNRQAIGEIDKLVDIQHAEVNSLLEQSEQQGQRLSWLLMLMGAVALATGTLFSWLTTRSIIGPLRDAVAVAKRVASGKLGAPIQVQGKDETSELLMALKEMDENLSQIVNDVRNGTQEIAGVSEELASGNLDLSARTEAQASALQQTASAMEQLTSTVKHNAENAQQANQLVGSASQSAVQGGEVVTRVVGTMGSIKESSQKIVDIISVIDGIAFQTNILALNAAVEAARAGEQGRGFAVVATEVRTLAQRSAQAAKEIKELIGDSVNRVENGNALVAQAGRQMEEIVAAVMQVATIMNDISVASQEQSSGIEEVNRAVAKMDEMTQHNAALVEQAAAAAGTLQERASRLGHAVSAFDLSALQGGQTAEAGETEEPRLPSPQRALLAS